MSPSSPHDVADSVSATRSTVVASRPAHPIYAVLLAATIPLFLGALLSDIAYARSYEIQWKNFASWLLVGGLVFGGLALLWGLVELILVRQRDLRRNAAFFLLLALWLLGFIDSLVHAKDAWASMPSGLILSALTALLAIAATAFGLSSSRTAVLR